MDEQLAVVVVAVTEFSTVTAKWPTAQADAQSAEDRDCVWPVCSVHCTVPEKATAPEESGGGYNNNSAGHTKCLKRCRQDRPSL